MSEQKQTRVRRTLEDRLAELNAKIEYHESCITVLRKKKNTLLCPPNRKRKTSMRTAIDALKESGLTPDEILALAVKATKK